MLKKFEVSGFKQFGHLTWDFSKIKEYDFNAQCIKDRLVKDGLVYGKNASGKTNLGLALFDIVANLTDKDSGEGLGVYNYYLKADEDRETANFSYEFLFGEHLVHYSYSKSSHKVLCAEKLVIDQKTVMEWPSEDGVYIDQDFIEQYKFGVIPWKNKRSDLSFVKYIFNNMVASEDMVLSKMKKFVNGMLWFRRNDQPNCYIGFSNTSENIFDYIVRGRLIYNFEAFLQKFAGMPVRLVSEKEPDGSSTIYFNYKHKIPLNGTASSGTYALILFYYWLKHKNDITLLFIDEFDAFYHYDLAKKVLEYLISNFVGQAFVTTHNTDLLTNKIIRPDCCFVLQNGTVRSFADSTERELRQSNNLERLYISGEFDG